MAPIVVPFVGRTKVLEARKKCELEAAAAADDEEDDVFSQLTANTQVKLSSFFSGAVKVLAAGDACGNPNDPDFDGWRPTLTEATAAYEETGSEDSTYICFCRQQKQIDPMVMWEVEQDPGKLCKEYTDKETSTAIWFVVGAISVVIVNQFLKVVMGKFVVMERHYFVTDVVQSQMKKLFVCQFINTGVIILLAKLHLGESEITGLMPVRDANGNSVLGEGAYRDFSTEWFQVVGAGLCGAILSQIAASTIPPILTSFVIAKMTRNAGKKKCKTQETLNDAYEQPEWNLALRMAQTMNVLTCTVIYSAGMPILTWIGLAYCVISYWADKICLLLGSKIPPMYSETVIQTGLALFPALGVGHCFLGLIFFGNQVVFPSNWVDGFRTFVFGMVSGFHPQAEDGVKMDINEYNAVMYGDMGELVGSGTRNNGRPKFEDDAMYRRVQRISRLSDAAREAAMVQGIVVVSVVFLFILMSIIGFIWIFARHPIMLAYRTVMRILCAPCNFVKHMLGKKEDRRTKIMAKMGIKQMTDGTYADHKNGMKEKRILHSYELSKSHKYRRAYLAIRKRETMLNEQLGLGKE
jgi:hypothetical protein